MKKLLILFGFIIVFGIFGLIYFNLPQKIPVLTYHNFTDGNESEEMTVLSWKFDRQMKFLSNTHFHSLTLDEVECFLNDTCKIPRNSVLITIDDGYRSTLDIAAPILKKYKMNAVLFYVGKNSNGEREEYLDKEDLETLKKEYPNITIASHTYDFHYDECYTLPYNQIKNDFERMKNVVDTPYFSYPYGKYSDEYIKVLKDEGYRLAFTFGPDKEHRKMEKGDNPYLIPRLNTSSDMPFWKFVLRLFWIQ